MIWTLRVTTGSDRLVLWDRFGLILHFLWAWQFALGCLIELALITSIALEGLAGAPIHDTTYLASRYLGTMLDTDLAMNRVRWVFVVLTFFLIITIVVQICIFANDCLCTNTYLWIQAVNVAYVTALYGIFAASMHHFDGGPLSLSLVWQITWQACVLWFVRLSIEMGLC